MTTTDLDAPGTETVYDPRLCRDAPNPMAPIDSPMPRQTSVRIAPCGMGETGGPCWRNRPILHVIDGVKGLRGELVEALDGFDALTRDLAFAIGGAGAHQAKLQSLEAVEAANTPAELVSAVGVPSLAALTPDAQSAIRMRAVGLQQNFIRSRVYPLVAKLEAAWKATLPKLQSEATKAEDEAQAATLKKLGHVVETRPLSAALKAADESLRYYLGVFRQQCDTGHPRSVVLTVEPVRRLLD